MTQIASAKIVAKATAVSRTILRPIARGRLAWTLPNLIVDIAYRGRLRSQIIRSTVIPILIMSMLTNQVDVKADRGPSAPELVEALLTLTQAIRRRHNARLASYDSSVPRARLLRAMLELGTPRMSELAANLGLTARTITTAVDVLERDGLLVRRPAPGDRRATLVELTAAGRAHIEEWQAFQRQLAEEVVAPLDAAERRQLIKLLERIRTEGLGE
jgi:DNA-binding MarR family transcriptional regulator